MRAKAHRTSKYEDWLVARQLRNQANNLAKLLKRNYYEGEISNSRCNPRKCWSLAKEASSKKNNITLPSCSNKLSLANNFNNFFVNIGADLAEAFQDVPPLGKFFPPTGTGDNAEYFSFSQITVTFVLKKIKEMDLSVATGVDGISCMLLKAACPSLAYLINRSLFSGIVPQKWKIARVTPIFLSGDRDQITNYRPISVLPLVSKVLEKAVNNQLRNFLGKNNFFADQQPGFRPHYSTQTTVLDVADFILHNMDLGSVTGAIFLDLKKAFDTVDHQILLSILQNCRVISL